MSEEIRPALTADEWDAREAVRQTQAGEWSFVEINADGWFEVGVRRLDGEPPSALKVWRESAIVPAVMALANAALPDGDPRKITRADVDGLDALVSAARAEWGAGSDEYHMAARVLAKLAAVLPPEGT